MLGAGDFNNRTRETREILNAYGVGVVAAPHFFNLLEAHLFRRSVRMIFPRSL